MPKSLPSVAVLTGDLVASTSLSRDEIARAFAALEACADTMAGWHGAPLHFTRQRGDGWQVMLARPRCALRTALAFRAALRAADEAFDARQSIAVGPGPDPASFSGTLNDQVGPMFVRSGRGLDAMKSARDADARLIFQGNDSATEGPTGAAFVLADHISRGWTGAQAEALLPLLAPEHGLSYTELARDLGKSRQAVTKSVQAAGWSAIRTALTFLERPNEDAPR